MQRIVLAVLAVCLIISTASANGDVYWQPGGRSGGRVADLTYDAANGVIYASVDGADGLVYESSDNGGNWSIAFRDLAGAGTVQYVPAVQTLYGLGMAPYRFSASQVTTFNTAGSGFTDLPVAMAVSSDGQTVLLGSDSLGIARSTDGGQTFANQSSGLPSSSGNYPTVQSLAVDPTNSSIAYAMLAGTGVYRSTDGGVNWNAFSTGLSASEGKLFVDPSTPGTVCLAGPNGIECSVSGGSWTQVLASSSPIVDLVENPDVPTQSYSVDSSGQLYLSADDDATWNPLGSPVDEASRSVLAFGDPAWIVVGTDAGIRISNNPAGGWTPSSNGMHANDVTALTGTAGDVARILVGREKLPALYAGDNSPDYQPGGGTGARSAVDMVARGNGALAITSQGLASSDDAGATWTTVPVDATSAQSPGADSTVLAVDPAAWKRILLGTNSRGVLVSTDGGRTWKKANVGLQSDDAVQGLLWDSRTSSRNAVYRITLNHGLAISRDGGVTWNYVLSGPLSPGVTAMALLNDKDSLLAAVRGNGIYLSQDGGTSWAPLPGQPETQGAEILQLAVDPVVDGVYYAVTADNGIYRTADSGKAWQKLDESGLPVPRDAAPLTHLIPDPLNDSSLLVAVRHGGLYSAQPLVNLSLETTSNAIDLSPSESKRLHFVIHNQGSLNAAIAGFLIQAPDALDISPPDANVRQCVGVTEGILCAMPPLVSGDSQDLSFTVTATQSGSYALDVTALSYEGDSDGSNNTRELKVMVSNSADGGGGGGGAIGLAGLLLLAGFGVLRLRCRN